MSESTNEYNVQIIISILGGIILFLSELLPFIKNVKSNGIVELLINAGRKYVIKNHLDNIEYSDIEHSDIERSPLLNNTDEQIRRPSIQDNLLSNIDKLNTNINNISHTLTNYINETQNSRQLKLQAIEIYELNYIINYIKVHYPKKMFQTKFLSQINKQLLISQGYTIDYDSQNDTHTIKW
jgi:hypothetical protein